MNKNDEEYKKKEFPNYENQNQNPIESKDKQKQIDSNSLNQLLSVIYDDEFVIMINDLSHEIKLYNRSMIQFINQMKINLSKNYTALESLNDPKDSELPNIHSLFNSIETSYKNFFASAKNIFKKMKKYRNERLENINKLSFGEKNLKFCFINMSKNSGLKCEGRGMGPIQNKSVDLKDNISSYSKGSSNKDINSINQNNINNINNVNNEFNKINEENIELKKKIFNLEKKIEIIGNNKKNIITNNINNISNYHLQENKNQNDMDLIRENKNIIKIIKNLINILEYEKSPDYSFNKNTFDNEEEIVEHKKEITTQKDELIFLIKKYLYDCENPKNIKNENISDINEINNNMNNNKSVFSIKQIDELKKIIEKLETKIKKISGENQNYKEEINILLNKNKEISEENKNLEEHDKKKSQMLQNQMVSLINQIMELKKIIAEKDTQYNELQQEQELSVSSLKKELKNISAEKIISEEKMLKLIQNFKSH